MYETIPASEKIWQVRTNGFSKFREGSSWKFICW